MTEESQTLYPAKVGKLASDHPLSRPGYEWTSVCFCGFTSLGWPTSEQAEMRRVHHQREHRTGEFMPDKATVEALTPDKFPTAAVATPSDTNDIWDAVN